MIESIDEIYLDYCATTPTDPRVLEVMLPFFAINFGNPSSVTHSFGKRAAEAVLSAREKVASLTGCPINGIIWTSGATEANNQVLRMMMRLGKKPKIITQSTEHSAILDPIDRNANAEFEVIDVNETGTIDLNALISAIRKSEMPLVSIMSANNETGVIQPIESVANACKREGAFFHTDAAQALGKIAFNFTGVNAASVSGHKVFGPKGVGALLLFDLPHEWQLKPLIDGGGQELGLRSGTLNVPAIVGFGEACRLAELEMEKRNSIAYEVRNHFETVITSAIEGCVIIGKDANRLPNVSNISFGGINSESLLLALPELAMSTGSACTTASFKKSHVLTAMKLPEDVVNGAVRVSFSHLCKIDQLDRIVRLIDFAVRQLRDLQY